MQVPDLESRYRVPPGRFRLAEHDPADTAGLDRERSCSLRGEDLERLRLLQKRLYAERRQSLLVVLQDSTPRARTGSSLTS